MEHNATYLGLIPLFPLIGALVIGLLHMLTCTNKSPLSEKLYGALACVGPVLSFFLALVVYFAVNHGVTGDMWTSAYHKWGLEVGRILGFGFGDMMWNRTHTPLHGLSQTFRARAHERVDVRMAGVSRRALVGVCQAPA